MLKVLKTIGTGLLLVLTVLLLGLGGFSLLALLIYVYVGVIQALGVPVESVLFTLLLLLPFVLFIAYIVGRVLEEEGGI